MRLKLFVFAYLVNFSSSAFSESNSNQFEVKNLSFHREGDNKLYVTATLINYTNKTFYLRGKKSNKNQFTVFIQDAVSSVTSYSHFLKKNVKEEIVILATYAAPKERVALEPQSKISVNVSFRMGFDKQRLNKLVGIGVYIRCYNSVTDVDVLNAKKIRIYEGVPKWEMNKSTKEASP